MDSIIFINISFEDEIWNLYYLFCLFRQTLKNVCKNQASCDLRGKTREKKKYIYTLSEFLSAKRIAITTPLKFLAEKDCLYIIYFKEK